MNNFDTILQSIKGHFSQRKKVDFEEEDLHFEIEPLTSKEEVIILESCKDIGESEYIEALKRHTLACSIKKVNEQEITENEIEYEPGKSKSKFLFMLDYLAEWPSGLIDLLFDAFTHMQREVEDRIKSSAKFERFKLSDSIEDEETKGEFRRLVENTSEGLSEVEKLKKKVDKEIEDADAHRVDTEQAAKEQQA